MKIKHLFNIAVIMAIVLSASSCKKEEATPEPGSTNTPNPPTTTSTPIGSGTNITSSIGGTVLDQFNLPVENALVSIGSSTTYTNALGQFIINNVSVDSDRAYVKVEKAGYFLGSRALNPEAGLIHSVKIKLITKSSIGIFNSNTGGTLSTSNASLTFEAGDISLSNGSAYSGNVNVYASYLDPMASDLSEIMPGDLQAKDDNNSLVILETYGMVVVELEGDNGESLNVAPGQTVELIMTVAQPQLSNAPSTIPLWYFDEVNGNWIQEGNASLQGSTYVGEVAHFSYWNCDDPYSSVSFIITIECNGVPLANVPVQMINTTTNQVYGTSYTNSAGQITDPIPAGVELTMNISDPCGGPLYTQNLGIVNSSLDLGVISLCNPANTTHFFANVVDCYGQPVTNGVVNISIGSLNVPYFTDANGNVDATITHCGQATMDVTAYDINNVMQSATVTLAVTASVNAGTLMACTQADEHMTYTLDGVNYFLADLGSNEASATTILGGVDTLVMLQSSNGNNSMNMAFEGNTVGTYPNSDILLGIIGFNWVVNGTQYNANANSIDIVVTTYANVVGDYFEGTFSGSFNDTQSNPHNLSGSFRLKRD